MPTAGVHNKDQPKPQPISPSRTHSNHHQAQPFLPHNLMIRLDPGEVTGKEKGLEAAEDVALERDEAGKHNQASKPSKYKILSPGA